MYAYCLGASTHNHNNYKSIITDEVFSTTDCMHKNHKYEITSNKSIVAYLTTEEIAKATNENMTPEDIKN